MRVWKSLAILLCSLCATSSGIAGSRNVANYGGWSVTAHTSDSSGQFTHCIASGIYKSGIFMMISIDVDYKWRMGFLNPAWNLQPGGQYGISYWVDRGRPVAGVANVFDKNSVFIELEDSQALFETFRRGHLLTVQAAGEEFNFSLENSSVSLKSALDCVNRNIRGPASNPFANGQQQAQPGAVDPGLKVEAATFTANVLSGTGMANFELVDPVAAGYTDYHAAFVAPGLVGGTYISPYGTVQDAAAHLSGNAAKRCTGQLATAKMPSRGDSVHIRVMCGAPGGASGESNYYLIPRSRGGIYAFELSVVTPSTASTTSTLPSGEPPDREVDRYSAKVLDASVTASGSQR